MTRSDLRHGVPYTFAFQKPGNPPHNTVHEPTAGFQYFVGSILNLRYWILVKNEGSDWS